MLCAEGYLLALCRRGYVATGVWVPEFLIDHPEVLRSLHYEFVRAGSDVTEAYQVWSNPDFRYDCTSNHYISIVLLNFLYCNRPSKLPRAMLHTLLRSSSCNTADMCVHVGAPFELPNITQD